MKQTPTRLSKNGSPAVANQGMPEDPTTNAQLAISGDLGLIGLGLLLLGTSGYLLLVKLCKSLTTNGNK